jgi:hypothetical protein
MEILIKSNMNIYNYDFIELFKYIIRSNNDDDILYLNNIIYYFIYNNKIIFETKLIELFKQDIILLEHILQKIMKINISSFYYIIKNIIEKNHDLLNNINKDIIINIIKNTNLLEYSVLSNKLKIDYDIIITFFNKGIHNGYIYANHHIVENILNITPVNNIPLCINLLSNLFSNILINGYKPQYRNHINYLYTIINEYYLSNIHNFNIIIEYISTNFFTIDNTFLNTFLNSINVNSNIIYKLKYENQLILHKIIKISKYII